MFSDPCPIISHAPIPSADPPDRFFSLLSFAFCLRYFFILILFILSNPLHSSVLSALCSIFPLSLFVYDFHILVCMLLSLGFPYIICSDIVSTPTTNPLIYRADRNTLFWHILSVFPQRCVPLPSVEVSELSFPMDSHHLGAYLRSASAPCLGTSVVLTFFGLHSALAVQLGFHSGSTLCTESVFPEIYPDRFSPFPRPSPASFCPLPPMLVRYSHRVCGRQCLRGGYILWQFPKLFLHSDRKSSDFGLGPPDPALHHFIIFSAFLPDFSRPTLVPSAILLLLSTLFVTPVPFRFFQFLLPCYMSDTFTHYVLSMFPYPPTFYRHFSGRFSACYTFFNLCPNFVILSSPLSSDVFSSFCSSNKFFCPHIPSMLP